MSGWRAEMGELLSDLEAVVVRMKWLEKREKNRDLARVLLVSKNL
jgi:hypothetical protein